MPRIANLIFAAAMCVTVGMVSMVLIRSSDSAVARDDSRTDRAISSHIAHPLGVALGAAPQNPDVTVEHADEGGDVYSVNVRKPSGPPRVLLAGADPQGRTGIAACSTCHTVRKPNFQNVSAATLDEFHQGMTFHHGKIACYACHNPDGSDSLRLADGTRVEYEDVMTLCSQCHGPQADAFEHGAHGGMNGHWDLTRGAQTKNNCVDCHDPHEPSYPKMVVGFKPKDRFNEPADHDQSHGGAESHDND